LTITPAASATSISYTYNPYLVGAKKITITPGTTDITGTSQAFTSAATDASTFTCGAGLLCNTNSAANWTCVGCASHNTPDTGDKLVSNGGHIVVPAGVAAQVGTCPANNTNTDVTLTPAGTNNAVLEVSGTATLRICGNVKANSPTSAAPTSFAIIQVATGGELDLDQNQNASVAYRIFSGNINGPNQFLAGTLGDACTFSTGACPTKIQSVNRSGNVNANLIESPAGDSWSVYIYGTNVVNCGGTSSAPCIMLQPYNPGTTYAAIDTLDIRNSLFNNTANLSINSTAGSANKFKLNLSDNRFITDISGFMSLQASSNFNAVASCTITRTYFSGMIGQANGAIGPCAWNGNVIAGWLQTSAWVLSALSGNLLVNIGVNDAFQNASLTTPAAYTRNVLAYPTLITPPASRHIFFVPVSNVILTREVCQVIGLPSEGHCANQNQGPSGRWQIMRDNFSLPTSSGQGNSGQYQIYDSNGSMATLWADHNAYYGQPAYSWGVGVGHGGNVPSNAFLQSYRDNVHWSPVNYPVPASDSTPGHQGVWPLAYNTSIAANVHPDVVVAARVGYNSMYNQTPSGSFGSGVNTGCNTGVSGGGTGSSAFNTPYDICTTGVAPGANDLLNLDPRPIDNTRSLWNWAQRLHGTDGTNTGLLNYLEQCAVLDQCIEEMRAWVARGFQPTNLRLKGAAHDGSIVGFSGTLGSGYTGACTVAVTPTGPPAGDDLGHDFAGTCTFFGGVPQISITNPGANYRIASPAAVAIGGTCTGGCVAASLVPVIAPHDLGPADAQMAILPSVM
jgi:hypothetical protein